MERRVSRKLSRTVWSQGKAGDDLKGLPMAIRRSDAFRRDGDRP